MLGQAGHISGRGGGVNREIPLFIRDALPGADAGRLIVQPARTRVMACSYADWIAWPWYREYSHFAKIGAGGKITGLLR